MTSSDRMHARTRTAIVILLGLALWMLVLHDLYWVRLVAILEKQSAAYLFGRLQRLGVPWAVLGAAVIVILGGSFWRLAQKRRSVSQRSSRGTRISLAAIIGLFFCLAALLILRTFLHGATPLEWSAPVSVAVAVSLLLFSFTSRKRVLLAGHLLLLLLALAAWLSPRLRPGHADRVRTLSAALDREQERLSRLRNVLGTVEPEALVDAAVESSSGFRFEENLGNIVSIETPRLDSDTGILYEAPGMGSLDAMGSGGGVRVRSHEGKIALAGYRAGEVVRNVEPLELDPRMVGSLVIRMKVSAGRNFRIHWSETERLDADVGVQLPLGPRGQFQTYEVSESVAELCRAKGLTRIRRVFLTPSDEDAEVEIEYLRILNRVASVASRAPAAPGYEEQGGELRRVLHLRSPIEVTYAARIPPTAPRMLFGLGCADPSVPIRFEVELVAEGRRTAVHSGMIEGREVWRDAALDLGPWAGRDVEIVVRAGSAEPNVVFWSNPLLLGEAQNRPNVVIYLVDCLRADHLGCYGYERELSPVLDRLASEGALFENAFSNGCHTKHSIPSLFTSNPVSVTGVRQRLDVLPETFPTLPEILRSVGYATAAFTTNRNVGRFSGTHQGFSRFFDSKCIMEGEEVVRDGATEGDADVLIGQTLERWLDQNAGRNFFLYVHTVDAHGPYDPLERYRRFFHEAGPGEPVRLDRTLDPPWLENPTKEARIALYDGEVAFGDVYLGRFVEMLGERGLWENTLFVFLADHGEYLGERDHWGHNSPPYVEVTHIPLVIVGSGIPQGARIPQNVQVLDVMPTILDYLGLPAGHDLLQGDSLLPLIRGESIRGFEGRALYLESQWEGRAAIKCGSYRFVPEKNFLFDSRTDPREVRYLNEYLFEFGLKSRARKLARLYRDAYAVLERRMADQEEGSTQLDPETVRQLRALGYID